MTTAPFCEYRATPMTFPVVFHPFGADLYAHTLFEALAYTFGFQSYLLIRRLRQDRQVQPEPLLWIFVGCVFGALIGAKVLAWVESLNEYWPHRFEPQVWLGGKTIVGGIIGGWIGVELSKKLLHIRGRTGDAYVVPLCLGIAIGRIGCFLTGLPDHTYGTASSLPWAVDFGDGVPRHPTQLYEMAWLLLMAGAFLWSFRWTLAPGTRFRWFILGYLGLRFVIEFIKPTWKPYAGLSAIQVASLLACSVAALQLTRRR